MPNQYADMCKRTCLDRNVLLIKCDAVSAEIALVPAFTPASLGVVEILIGYLHHLMARRMSLHSVWLWTGPLTRTNDLREGSLCTWSWINTQKLTVWLLNVSLQKNSITQWRTVVFASLHCENYFTVRNVFLFFLWLYYVLWAVLAFSREAGLDFFFLLPC